MKSVRSTSLGFGNVFHRPPLAPEAQNRRCGTGTPSLFFRSKAANLPFHENGRRVYPATSEGPPARTSGWRLETTNGDRSRKGVRLPESADERSDRAGAMVSPR